MRRVSELLSEWNISESTSLAAKQAKLLSLKHKGFGRWKDSKGVVTHVTRNGQLVPVTQKSKSKPSLAKEGEKWWQIFESVEKAKSKFGRNIALIDTNDEKQVELANAITIWTNGHIPAVRSIEKYSPGHSGQGDIVNLVCRDKSAVEDSEPGIGSPWKAPSTKSDYKKAGRIMSALASRPADISKPIYRGLKLEQSELEELTPGVEINLGSIASFSTYENTAKDFANDQSGSKEKIIMTTNPSAIKRGSPINEMSHFNNEYEFVTSGKVRIVDVEWLGEYTWVEVEQL